MPIISTDQSETNKLYTVHYDSSPETFIVKQDVVVYLYSNSGAAATFYEEGFAGAGLVNYGHVVGDGAAVGAWFKDGNALVRNGAGGDIVAEGGGVRFDGRFSELDNDGLISSSSYSAAFGDGGVLHNTGRMVGAVYGSIKQSSLTIDNSGLIDAGGGGTALLLTGAAETTFLFIRVVNAGTLNGGVQIASVSGDATSSIANSGLISGDIDCYALDDTVINGAGHITGDVSLRGGADTFDNRGGHVDGVVYGGAGDDVFIVDATPVSIYEDTNGGSDTLASSTISLSLANYSNIENLKVLGGLNLNLTGDAGDNILSGNAGRNALKGGLGDDTYYVQNAADTISEAKGAGYDTVHSTVSFSLAGQYVEHLILDGSAATDATGNTQNNLLSGNGAANLFIGGAGADTLEGGGGTDTASYATAAKAVTANLVSGGTSGDAAGDRYSSIENLIGSKYADVLTGDGSVNVLTGGAGADTMTGGKGGDTYYVDNSADVVVEANVPADYDAVHATASFSLAGQYIETLFLEGNSAIDGTGNSLANYIQGNAKANVIEGGKGDDVFLGGAGADTFVYHAKFGMDTIEDFAAGSGSGHDLLRIDKSLFANYAAVIAHATEMNNDGVYTTTITYDANNTITLLDTAKADLTSADFLFG
ncbi:MAG TPA: calcium-binding protein [Hansschlegelia sp.]